MDDGCYNITKKKTVQKNGSQLNFRLPLLIASISFGERKLFLKINFQTILRFLEFDKLLEIGK